MISALSFLSINGAFNGSCNSAVTRASLSLHHILDWDIAPTQQTDDYQAVALAAGCAVGCEAGKRPQVGS